MNRITDELYPSESVIELEKNLQELATENHIWNYQWTKSLRKFQRIRKKIIELADVIFWRWYYIGNMHNHWLIYW